MQNPRQVSLFCSDRILRVTYASDCRVTGEFSDVELNEIHQNLGSGIIKLIEHFVDDKNEWEALYEL